MIAACCLLASPALADGEVDVFVNYGEVLNGEFGGGVGGRVSLGGTSWMFDFTATWIKEVVSIPIVDDPSVDDDSFQIFPLDLGFRYIIANDSKARPYVGAGLSYVLADANRLRVEDGLGFYGILGVRVGKQPGINFVAEAIYRYSEVNVIYGPRLDQDVKVGGLGAQAGIALVF
jgi:hypothetical protein